MPVRPDWSALRRPLRSCAIGALVLTAFLGVWQFLVPGDHSSALVGWAFVLGSSVSLSSGIGLPVSASRRLWRSRQRSRAALPVAFLCLSVIALPMALGALGASWTTVFYAVPFGLLLSAAFSSYLLITAQPAAPSATRPTDFNTDEPHAYVSDIPRKRSSD
jgi:hypothetical protein